MIVTVIGAAGGVGQAVSLLLKLHLPAGTVLRLLDRHPGIPGVALDAAHIPTSISVESYAAEEITQALHDATLVLVPAGMPRKPGMTRDDLFQANATIVTEITEHVANAAPTAALGIITNPVNSMVPLAAKILEKKGVYNPRKLFGVTTLDVLRARSILGRVINEVPEEIMVDVVGGHSESTMLPILSSIADLSPEKQAEIRVLVQNAGKEVVERKAGLGSATLAMGAAALEFSKAVLLGLAGQEQRICTYIPTEFEETPFFAKPVIIGKDGVSEEKNYGPLSPDEEEILYQIIPLLKEDIAKGLQFGQ